LPTVVLPNTLKVQPTDTDKRDAIQSLVNIVQEHAGEVWADNLLQGAFGQRAAAAVTNLNEYINASNALQKAKADRASAVEPAWDAFVSYKRLGRDTLGSSSRQYQGLRLRNVSADETDETDAVEGGEDATPAPESAPVPSVH